MTVMLRTFCAYRVKEDRVVHEDVAVDEFLEVGGVHAQGDQHAAGVVLAVPDHAQEEMVGGDSVTAGAHRLFAGVPDDAVEFVRYLYFHTLQK